MYNPEQYKALENKSHIRGLLSKQFYSEEIAQQQRKKLQMKMILDQQVEERKKQKEKEKVEQQNKNRLEEESIKNYYANISHKSKQDKYQQSFNSNTPYSPPTNIHTNIRQSIPVMSPLYLDTFKQPKNSQLQYNTNIPVLDLRQEKNQQKHQKIQKAKKKTQKNNSMASYINPNNSNYIDNQNQLSKNKNSLGTIQKKNNKEHYEKEDNVQEKIDIQLENQNQMLKNQLKKSQQAISLLIGAVRSNPRLDKFRIQAQHILRGNSGQKYNVIEESNVQQRPNSNKEKISLKLPKLNIKGQSIMHDYLFTSVGNGKQQSSQRRKTLQNQI